MRLSRIILASIAFCAAITGAAQVKYKNPVYGSDFPDPTVQRAKNGTFYSYATGCKTLTSKDLVHWTKKDNAIGRPTWNDSTYVNGDGKKTTDYYSFWACDVSYLDGKYYMQYACALWGNGSRTGIGVAVGDTPDKFTDKGKLFRSTEIGVANSIDPCFYQEKDKKYIIWGSFNDICIAELTDDGLAIKNFRPLNNPNSNPSKTRPSYVTKIAGGAFEGPMIYKRGKYYYLFASVGSCCNGENSTYKTVVGRATSLKGPYLNKQGGDMKNDNYTTIIKGNDRWRGPGHNSEIITDDEGQDWLLYHSYDMNNGCDGRLMLLDKINWVNDWPEINDGTPSSDEHDGPVFYTGDGANMTYKMDNADMSMSKFKYWNATCNESCTLVSSAGTNVFMPFAKATSATGGGTFDINQQLTGLKNGIYEVKLNDYSKGDNVDIYVNTALTPALTGDNLPASDATTSTKFLAGSYVQCVYGIVTNGKLTIGMRSRAPQSEGDRFAAGNFSLIYREKNVEVAKKLVDTYAENIQRLDTEKRPYYKGYRQTLRNYLATAQSTETDTDRYTMLTKIHQTADSLNNSFALYDSLCHEVTRMDAEVQRATATGFVTEDAKAVLAEAQQVAADCSYTDKEVAALIARMLQLTRAMFYVYTEGDGTAEKPYIINTAEQLDHMHDVLVKDQTVYFKLANDVDMANFTWKQLNGSASSYRYWINFDGQGHLIHNLTVAADKGYPSFFGTLCGECRNVGFVNAQIDGTNGTGAAILAGCLGNSTYMVEETLLPIVVENCYVTGNVAGKGYLGAIGGNVASSPVFVRNVYSAANVDGANQSGTVAGGLIGRIRSDLTVEKAYAAGNTTGFAAGGVVGGGQAASTKASVYNNVFAWGREVAGETALPWGAVRDIDQQTDLYYKENILINGEATADGISSYNLRQKASQWGAPWHSNPEAGNGFPILEWQYQRGDYRTFCGFSIEDGIDNTNAATQTQPQATYDLQGRRITTGTLQRGLYIIDGRKVIVK